jgi:hypothetical protein
LVLPHILTKPRYEIWVAIFIEEGGDIMKIFIDSADLEEIEQGYAWGVLDGVTTNPSLLKKAVEKRVKAGEKLDLKAYITRILEAAKGTPVSLEVTEFTAEKMIDQAKRLYTVFNPVAGNVYIKIPGLQKLGHHPFRWDPGHPGPHCRGDSCEHHADFHP